MSSKKRPAAWDATSFGFKQARSATEFAQTEYQEPRIVNSLPLESHQDPATKPQSRTDFTTWSETAIREFLDRRGEDYDDCVDFYALVQRAYECEQNTQPASVAPAEEEDDPLEAFMADIDQTIAKEKEKPSQAPPDRTGAAGEDGCDHDDAMAEYIEAHAAFKADKGKKQLTKDFEGYGSDEEVYAVAQALDTAADDEDAPAAKQQGIDPLPPMQHELVNYSSFKKNLYDENPEIFALDDNEVEERRRSLQVQVSGANAPKPVMSFDQCGFDKKLLDAIEKAGYKEPTAIQAQALPAALLGRDVLGIAKTGSGKTAAFVLPMIVHISDQPRVQEGQGPIAVILAPTRELAEQIHQQCRQFSRARNFRCCAAFGGLQKYAQMKELRAGAEVAVATPGRLIDLVKSRACDFLRTTYLVIDEADRCFDLGFEPQVFSIVRHIRPDRQTLLFSATMPRKVRHLAREALTDPVNITVGTPGSANVDIRQAVLVMASEEQKLQWLRAKMQGFVDEGDVLVFCNQKKAVDDLVTFLKGLGIKAEGMHGDLDQHSRMAILHGFKGGASHVLVATDVAARGLDIRSIKTVINFDAAKEVDTHVHRIGRTGRAGDKDGTAYTLLMPRESRMAAALVRMLQDAGQDVPKNLWDISMKDHAFKKSVGGGKSKAVGGRGLGFAPPSSGSHAPTGATAFQRASSDGPAASSHSQKRTHAPTPRTQFAPASGSATTTTTSSSSAPRGFVSSNTFAGGDHKSQATIVMPVSSEAAAAKKDKPAEWMQKRLMQSGRQGGPVPPRFPGPSATGPPTNAFEMQDAVARAVEAAKQAAARAREEADRVRDEASARLGFHPGAEQSSSYGPGTAAGFLPPPPRGQAPPSMHAVPPPAFGYANEPSQPPDSNGSAAGRRPPLSAEEARALAQAAAARIVGGGGAPPGPPPGAAAGGGPLPGGPPPLSGVPKAPLSAEDARALAQAAAARIVAQSGSAIASGQTQDGQQWAWGKS